MNGFVLVLFMIIVGALIGGVTNSLAIRMLFRPYRPIYIGKYRLPFTPGLIPKRRNELSVQLGRMVTNHLLTPDSIRKNLLERMFFTKMTTWVSAEIKKVFHSPDSFSEKVERVFEIRVNKQRLVHVTERFLFNKMNQYIEENKDKELSEILPPEILAKGHALIPAVSQMITKKGADFFKGAEGRKQLEILLEKFLSGKGSVFHFLGSMFGSDRIVEKLQPEIVRFFEDPAAEASIREILNKEWGKLQAQPLGTMTDRLDVEGITNKLASILSDEVPLYDYVDMPLAEWAPHYEDKLENDWMPALMGEVQRFFMERLTYFMEQLQIEQIVKEQVDTFSVDRLEALILGISRREFKMITYLGALLGGFVGLIQSLFVTVFL